MTKTRAQLEAENAALRELIRAVQQYATLPWPDPARGMEGWDEYYRLGAARLAGLSMYLHDQNTAIAEIELTQGRLAAAARAWLYRGEKEARP